MLGIDYNKKNKLWVVFDLNICECGNHVCKTLVRGNPNLDTILEYIKQSLSKTTYDKKGHTSHK